jgi:hypothetical protein
VRKGVMLFYIFIIINPAVLCTLVMLVLLAYGGGRLYKGHRRRKPVLGVGVSTDKQFASQP